MDVTLVESPTQTEEAFVELSRQQPQKPCDRLRGFLRFPIKEHKIGDPLEVKKHVLYCAARNRISQGCGLAKEASVSLVA